MAERAFTYIFSLVYPAILGTFFFSTLARSQWTWLQVAVCCLMIVYFLVQYGEGMIAGRATDGSVHYGPMRFVQDALEALAMVAVFASIGFFSPNPGQPASWLDFLSGWHWWAMGFAFAIPPAGRWLRRFARHPGDKATTRDKAIGGRLGLLSGLVVLGCVTGALLSPFAGLGLIALALAIYLGAFVFR